MVTAKKKSEIDVRFDYGRNLESMVQLVAHVRATLKLQQDESPSNALEECWNLESMLAVDVRTEMK